MEDTSTTSAKIERVEDMPVYQAFYTLALDVEKTTRDYGPDFRWLRNQALRASESVCANMTEGFYSQYSTEYVQSLYRCRREARETMTHLRYARDVGMQSEAAVRNLLCVSETALRQLANLIASIERKIRTVGKTKPLLAIAKEDAGVYDAGLCEPWTMNHELLTMNHQP